MLFYHSLCSEIDTARGDSVPFPVPFRWGQRQGWGVCWLAVADALAVEGLDPGEVELDELDAGEAARLERGLDALDRALLQRER